MNLQVTKASSFALLRNSDASSISFEDVMMAIRRDEKTVARIFSKLEALEHSKVFLEASDDPNADESSNQPESEKSSGARSSKRTRALSVLEPLTSQSFASTGTAGLLYGRLLVRSVIVAIYVWGVVILLCFFYHIPLAPPCFFICVICFQRFNSAHDSFFRHTGHDSLAALKGSHNTPSFGT